MQTLLFFSGLGIFLLAMHQMESSLRVLGNNTFNRSMQQFTHTPIHGIVLGIVATTIFQSSSIVGLITLAFVGAGMIHLKNAIGIILGSNLGTTFTGWLVALIGFKLNLTEFYLPIMGLGALGITFFNQKKAQVFQIIFAFGLLLMGLLLMKDSVLFILNIVDISQLKTLPPIMFFIVGILLTAIIQSSSATMMITLSAVNAGIIDLSSAVALIIGADLGTTSTVIIGSLQGSEIKKQVALIHLVFNCLVDIIAFLSIPLLLFLVLEVFKIDDPLFSLVAIHSSFNLIGIMCFLPFVGKLQQWVESVFPVKKKFDLYISKVSVEVIEAAFKALDKDIKNLILISIFLNEKRLKLTNSTSNDDYIMQFHNESPFEIYRFLKRSEHYLTNYIMDLQKLNLSAEQTVRTQQLLVCIRDTLYSAKAMKDIQHDIEYFEKLQTSEAQTALQSLLANLERFYQRSTLLLNETQSQDLGLFSDLFELSSTAHTELNEEIYTLIDHKQFKSEEASTVFNINREILLSGHSLINVLENYLLSQEKAQTLSELIKIQR